MIKRLIPPTMFGAVDGLGLAIGLILVLGRSGVLAAAAANAASEFAGMSSGEYLSRRGQEDRVPIAFANGTASAVGALFPVFAYLAFGRIGAVIALTALAVLVATLEPSDPWWRSWAETGVTIGFVVLVNLLVVWLHP